MIAHEFMMVLGIAMKLALLGIGLLYLFRVLWTYYADGLKLPLDLRWSDPARSADELAIWVGVRVVDSVWTALRWAVRVLEEASADVGGWFIGHRGA